MLIYFEKQRVLINTEKVISVEYIEENSIPSLHFTESGSTHAYIDIFFNYKEEALSTLEFISSEYAKNPRQILVIHNEI